MFINSRIDSEELTFLRYLHTRMDFSDAEGKYLMNLEKGFEGEKKFDRILQEKLPDESLILCDLLLEVNNTVFQLDSLLCKQNTIYQFEVKNYDGDFYIEDEQWYSQAGNEIKNPLIQLKRSETLLRQLLQQMKCHFQVKSYLIFVNPEFHLYQCSKDLPIIFPTQMNRFMDKLKSSPSKVNQTHTRLAKQLITEQISQPLFRHVPKYEFDQLRKGVSCSSCFSFMTRYNTKNLYCPHCDSFESISSAIKRSIIEFNTLFPNKKITKNIIYEWCGEIASKKTIRIILNTNFKMVANGRFTYYELKEQH